VHGHTADARFSRPPELTDLDLAHPEHGLHGPAGAIGVRVGHQLVQRTRHDLPREPEAVLDPAARARLAAIGGQGAPEPVDLGLVLALEDE
jgi:hypothetical protein